MPPYRYSPLLPGPDSIRLLRLLPHKDRTAPIQCELFDYTLQEPSQGTHLYEALSYVWGGQEKPRSISIDGQDLPVTVNLHEALSHLRDHFFDRIIWADAICIDQTDLKERGHQVQCMAKIYCKANRVIAWLGDAADDSDRALEHIYLAAKQTMDPSSSQAIQQAIFAVLQRPWFRRIWVREPLLNNIP